VVSVLLVIEPCVKFGTTGTAIAVLAFTRTNAPATRTSTFFIGHSSYYCIVSVVTTCPVAVVPAPPAVSVIAPSVAIVPARLPA